MLIILLFIILTVSGFVIAHFTKSEFIAGILYIISTVLVCILILMITTVIIEHMPSEVSSKKIELDTKYEWLIKNKDNPYIIDDIIEYNCDVKINQKVSQSLRFNWFINPAYEEAKTIDIE